MPSPGALSPVVNWNISAKRTTDQWNRDLHRHPAVQRDRILLLSGAIIRQIGTLHTGQQKTGLYVAICPARQCAEPSRRRGDRQGEKMGTLTPPRPFTRWRRGARA